MGALAALAGGLLVARCTGGVQAPRRARPGGQRSSLLQHDLVEAVDLGRAGHDSLEAFERIRVDE